jgi:tetratricopeptide (TPR) repeat protein
MKFKSGLFNFSIISLFILVLLVAFSSPLGAQTLSARKKASALAASMQPAQAAQPAQATEPVQAIQPVPVTQPVPATTAETAPTAETAKPTQKLTSGEDADYWFNKGALCATYGNDRAAIKYFQKTITLDPNRSGAYFEEGISYGQLGQFDKALALIDKALEMQPQNGLYLYGRGRVYLLAGEKEKAMQDFKKAAELDNDDARNYLDWLARNEESSTSDE